MLTIPAAAKLSLYLHILSGYSVREVLKNSTPHPSSKGEGGLDPPESQPSPKSLNFLLILYFSRLFLEHVSWNCIFRAYTMIYWAKQALFGIKMKNKGGGGTCVLLHSCGVIAATEGLPPLQGIYTGIRGARINKKRKKFTPPFNFPKTGGGVPFWFFTSPLRSFSLARH